MAVYLGTKKTKKKHTQINLCMCAVSSNSFSVNSLSVCLIIINQVS